MNSILRHRGREAGAALLAIILAVACDDSPGVTEPLTGSITITVQTAGAVIDLDPNGYTLSIDSGPSQALPVNIALTIPDLAPGSHLVLLDGLSPNCSVAGTNPRPVDVGGTGNSAASVTFSVSCKVNTGSIQVSAVTSGPDPDPTGYSVVVGGGSAHVAANGTRNIADLREGSYDVFLTDIAGNCVVDGPNPVRVNVTFGTSVQAGFAVRCLKEAGLVVTTTTTGVNIDPDGYLLEVRGETPANNALRYFGAPTNGNATLSGLLPGSYEVTLTGVMANCDLASNKRAVTVSAESDTPVVFTVVCSPPGQLAFVHYGFNADIYVVNSNGTGSTRLTNAAAFESETGPAWSPDGSRIAFSGTRDGNLEIYVMNADGTNQIRLTTAQGWDDEPAWSPDGLRIAFVSRRNANDPEIYVMNADGTNPVRLTTKNGDDVSPAWSPDGSRIVFSSQREGGSQIWVMNADGSGVSRLTSGDFGGGQPAWSPDGSKIAFQRGASASRSAIFLMNADGSNVTRLSDVFDWAGDPTWSPDGRKIAFGGLETYDYYTSYWPLIFVIGVDGTPYTSPTSLTGIDIAWRPR